MLEITQAKQKKEILKNESSVRDLWDNIRHTDIHIMEVSEGEEREKKKADNFFVKNDS